MENLIDLTGKPSLEQRLESRLNNADTAYLNKQLEKPGQPYLGQYKGYDPVAGKHTAQLQDGSIVYATMNTNGAVPLNKPIGAYLGGLDSMIDAMPQ